MEMGLNHGVEVRAEVAKRMHSGIADARVRVGEFADNELDDLLGPGHQLQTSSA